MTDSNRAPKKHSRYTAAIGFTALAFAAAPAAASDGIFPEGLFTLNLERSDAMFGKSNQVLWIIKDDGKTLVFALVEESVKGDTRILTWSGVYGGEAAPILGDNFTLKASSTGKGHLQWQGVAPDGGTFTENCVYAPANRSVRCDGELRSGENVRKYVDHYDWASAAPRYVPPQRKDAK
jgi:hypothetical protein